MNVIAVTARGWDSGPHVERGDETLGPSLFTEPFHIYDLISLHSDQGGVIAIYISRHFLLSRGGIWGSEKVGALLLITQPGKSQPWPFLLQSPPPSPT